MIINEQFFLATMVVGGKLISITLTGNFHEKEVQRVSFRCDLKPENQTYLRSTFCKYMISSYRHTETGIG